MPRRPRRLSAVLKYRPTDAAESPAALQKQRLWWALWLLRELRKAFADPP